MTCPKFRHDSEASARRQLVQLKHSSRENRKILNKLAVYRCECGWYHVGHSKYRGKQYHKPVPDPSVAILRH